MKPYGASNIEYVMILTRNVVFGIIMGLFALLFLLSLMFAITSKLGAGLAALLTSIVGLWSMWMSINNYRQKGVQQILLGCSGILLLGFLIVIGPWVTFATFLLIVGAMFMISWDLPGSRI